jgi:uncharacterized membrane protein YeaQ/YmgE (transglycosylase-associated protein family)
MELITFIFWLVVTGLIVGALARLIVPGPQPIGLIRTALLGIVGSFIGGVLFWAIADRPAKDPLLGFVIAVACAAALIWFFVGSTGRRPVFGRRRWL